MQRSSLVSAFVIAFLAGAHFAGAQKPRKEPPRPALIAGADTNDARAYYAHGLSKIERDPEEAGDAFYWAMRINPTFADAYYARRCALLLTDRIRFQQYMEDDRGTLRSDEIKRIDSLYYFSLTILLCIEGSTRGYSVPTCCRSAMIMRGETTSDRGRSNSRSTVG